MGGVGNLLLGACKAFSRKPAIIYGRETLTYGDYRKQLLQVAGLLAQAGLKPGDRVAVISRNLPEYLVIFGAAEVAGDVVVPVNIRLTAEEVLYVLKHSGAVAFFLEGAALVELGREIRPQAPDVRLWVSIGDVGRIDEEGYVYILDRKNDLIITGGENVYPSAVEAALLSHPEIEEAGVVGVPDIEWGEKVKAFVVLKDGSRLGPKDVTDFCRGRLGGHKCPREVQFVRELPKNSVGKVLRRKLRENQA